MGNLISWAVMFLVIAIIAALLGFGGVAGTAMAGAKLLFWVAIALFIIALIGDVIRRRRISSVRLVTVAPDLAPLAGFRGFLAAAALIRQPPSDALVGLVIDFGQARC